MNGVSALPSGSLDDVPRIRRLKLSDLNQHLMCLLCGGYYVDATTIIECLHSFCRTCIVKYLETSKYCPICDVQVHKTKPLLNIRSDQTLQEIAYKLVPGLFQREMKRRRNFHLKHAQENVKNLLPSSTCDASKMDTVHRVIAMPDEYVSLSLEYSDGSKSTNPELEGDESKEKKEESNNTEKEAKETPANEILSSQAAICRRFLKCPGAVTISHIKKLIRSKYGLSRDNKVEIICDNDNLSDSYTLMDISYIYFWKKKGPMRLYFQIYEAPVKRQKVNHVNVLSMDNTVVQSNIVVQKKPDENERVMVKTTNFKLKEKSHKANGFSKLDNCSGIFNTEKKKHKREVEDVVVNHAKKKQSVQVTDIKKLNSYLKEDSITNGKNEKLPTPVVNGDINKTTAKDNKLLMDKKECDVNLKEKTSMPGKNATQKT